MSRNRITNVAVSVALFLIVGISVLVMSDSASVADAMRQLVLSSVAVILLCLTAGMLLAALRLKLITADLGYRLSLRDAAMTLSIGQLAGSVFFQFAGQIIGRTAVLARHGVPTSASVIISGYERLFAVSVSLGLAACGALYLFGTLSVDLQAGGLGFIKLALGLIAAVVAGAIFAWGDRAKHVLRQVTLTFALRCLRSLTISLAIQSSTLAAY